MKYPALGASGLRVSEIALGTMTFGSLQCDEPTSFAIMDAAAERGVDFIDTADKYPVPAPFEAAGRTEEIVGRWLRGKRDRFVLTTKCGNPMGPGPRDYGLSRKHVIEACEASLRRLQTDRIDLYQLHIEDPSTPIEETLSALDRLVASGKVLYAGCSNFSAWRIAMALGASALHEFPRFISIQPRYNLLYREPERELFPLAQHEGLAVLAYNPLAAGLLSGKYRGSGADASDSRFALGPSAGVYRQRYWQDAAFAAVEQFRATASARDLPMAAMAVAWMLAKPAVTCVLVGATRPDQLDDTIGAVDVTLDAETIAELDRLWYMLPRRPASEEE